MAYCNKDQAQNYEYITATNRYIVTQNLEQVPDNNSFLLLTGQLYNVKPNELIKNMQCLSLHSSAFNETRKDKFLLLEHGSFELC